MAHNVTTEWFDQQVKYGNYIPNDKQTTNDEIEKYLRDELDKYDPLDHKNLDQLDELEDIEDDRVLAEYKMKRLNELKEYAKGAKFGSLKEIRKHEYKQEVTDASQHSFVVLLLHQEYIEQSRVLNEILSNLAKKFPCVKFLKIEANNCIDNFRDQDCPTLFIYKEGKLFKQFLPAPYYFGGNRMTWKKVEWIFNSLKVVESDLQDDPFEELTSFHLKKDKKLKRDDESDSEDDQKPNRWKKYP